jgi:hypothetical protein
MADVRNGSVHMGLFVETQLKYIENPASPKTSPCNPGISSIGATAALLMRSQAHAMPWLTWKDAIRFL